MERWRKGSGAAGEKHPKDEAGAGWGCIWPWRRPSGCMVGGNQHEGATRVSHNPFTFHGTCTHLRLYAHDVCVRLSSMRVKPQRRLRWMFCCVHAML
eukprot:4274486-Prymnesium_polylepis.1